MFAPTEFNVWVFPEMIIAILMLVVANVFK